MFIFQRTTRLKIGIKALKHDFFQVMNMDKTVKVLPPDYLSPGESVDEHGDFQQFIVRRQLWLNERFNVLKDKLEEMNKAMLSPQHRRQLKAGMFP